MITSLLNNKPKDLCRFGDEVLNKYENIETLLTAYKSGIDFCFDNNYPTKEQLLRFAGAELERHGFFIDKQAVIYNSNYIIALGNSRLTIKNAGYNPCQTYAKNNSKLLVEASGESFLMIDAFDRVEIQLNVSDAAKVVINLYGKARVINRQDSQRVILNKKKGNKYQ